ncbi:hypothetical protein Tco_0873911 [Tanacetum coccineum]|uniref:Uncharacterized protein n=1 Tax=Tanacetum coccineum TaxID=301880 RepID=A0ABQ5BK51_9ASTR
MYLRTMYQCTFRSLSIFEELVATDDEAHTTSTTTPFYLQQDSTIFRTPPLLPIPLPAPSTSRRADIPEADTPPRKRLLLTTPRPGCEIGESLFLRLLPKPNTRKTDRTAVRAEIEVLRRERLAYEQESIQTRQDLARVRLQNDLAVQYTCVPRPWKLENAMTH